MQNLKDRWRAHKSHANRNATGALQAAIRKHGASEFSVTTLVIAKDYSYLKALEISAIAAFGTKAPAGYNLTDGGDGVLGVIVTDEGRKKRSESQKKVHKTEDRKLKAHKSLSKARQVQKELGVSESRRISTSNSMKRLWADPKTRQHLMDTRARGPRILDGLTRVERYRLKDLDAYRKKKREWAKTPDQRIKRAEYMRAYNAKKKASKLVKEN